VEKHDGGYAHILNASILIVDDQESNVSLLERLLGEAGYICVASTMNPQEVGALHRKNGYDLILLDLQMPGMDGFQSIKTNESDSYLAKTTSISGRRICQRIASKR
jgi:CheY-like chemotaxis protein